ncbi:MAG TPA: hypothetical protein VKC51_03195 [Lacunisphaera sp.]|nr:hypothetical protein [Lacunisphaera sp.]
MAENPFTHTTTISRAVVAQATPDVIRGANWFWWIAGLSVVNTVMIHSGGDMNFVIGLGFTLVADAVFKEQKLIAFAIDAVALGTIFGLGFLSRKGHLWAFVTGIVLYALDALIYVMFQDWMSVGFHGLALFYLIRGASRLRGALKVAAEAPPPVAAPPVASA